MANLFHDQPKWLKPWLTSEGFHTGPTPIAPTIRQAECTFEQAEATTYAALRHDKAKAVFVCPSCWYAEVGWRDAHCEMTRGERCSNCRGAVYVEINSWIVPFTEQLNAELRLRVSANRPADREAPGDVRPAAEETPSRPGADDCSCGQGLTPKVAAIDAPAANVG